jgi:hypothetical protein
LNKCVLPKFIRKIPGGIHQKEGHLEMAKNWKCLWKFFTFEKFLTWAGRPWELGHMKNLFIFQLERLLITMRSILKKKLSSFSLTSKSPMRIRPLLKSQSLWLFYQRAGRLE